MALSLAAALPARADDGGLNLKGRYLQSGYAVGQATPGADIVVDGVSRGPASPAGWFYVGFDRDAPTSCQITLKTAKGQDSAVLAVAPTTYDLSLIHI